MNYIDEKLEAEVKELKAQHQILELKIKEFSEQNANQLEVRRLKKKKLYIKDRIVKLTKDLNPDIIA